MQSFKKVVHSKKFQVAAILIFSLSAMFGFLLNQRDWFELCFQNRVIEDLNPKPTNRSPIAKQTVMFIFDDVSDDTAQRNLTRIQDKAQKEGFVSNVVLDSFTFTIAGVYTLGTGDQPSLVQVKSDFLSKESVANNIFENVRITGKKSFHIGEALWLDNFKRGIDDSFTRRDLGLFVNYGSDKMMEELRGALADKQNGLITIHIAETGHFSHKYGVFGEPLKELHQRLEAMLLDLAKEYIDGVAWLVLSDHGTTEQGQHGGISKSEQTSFLWAFGEGIGVSSLDSISQVDIVNIVSVLTGAPLLTQNCGILPNIFGPKQQVEYQLAQKELLQQKQVLYSALREKFGDSQNAASSSLESLTKGVNRIKFDSSASQLLLPRILVAVCLILVWISTFKKEFSIWHLVFAVASLTAIFNVPSSFSWLLFIGCAAGVVPLFRNINLEMLKPIGVAFCSMAIVSGIFYLFPSQVYLKQSAMVRSLFLYATIGLGLVLFWVYGLVTVSNKKESSISSYILWGVSAAFIVATPCRYYLYVVPLGYVVLLGLSYYHQERSTKALFLRFVKVLPILALVIFAALCQIPDLGLNFFRKLPIYLRGNSWSAQIIFAAGIVGFATWLNRYYQGCHKVWLRVVAVAIVFGLHLIYQSKLTNSNYLLIGLFVVAAIFFAVVIAKEKKGYGDYWLIMSLMAVMTQQQTGVEFVLVMLSTILFRWMYKSNPYAIGSNKRYFFSAFLIIVYFVHFLTVQGQLFEPTHFMILKVFIGFKMPLILPISVALLVFYYLQPLLLSWLVVRLTIPFKERPKLFNTAIVAASLFLLQVVFTNLLFSFSLCPGDTYIKTSAGSLIIMTFSLGLIVLAGFSRIVYVLKGR